MRNGQQHATFGRLAAKRGYMLLLVLCPMLGACFLQDGTAAWRYEQAERLVDDGVMALRAGRLGDAQAAFELAREHAPLAAALDGQGCVAFLRGDLAGAEALFREAYESDADYDEALGNLALVLDVAGRDEEAAALYETLLEQHPEAARQRNNWAALAFDLGRQPSDVETELTKAAFGLEGGLAQDNLRRIRNEKRSTHGEKSD